MTGDGNLWYEFWVARICFVVVALWWLIERFITWNHFPRPWTLNFKVEIALRTAIGVAVTIAAFVWVNDREIAATASKQNNAPATQFSQTNLPGATGIQVRGNLIVGKPPRTLIGRQIPTEIMTKLKGHTVPSLTIYASTVDENEEARQFANQIANVARNYFGWTLTQEVEICTGCERATAGVFITTSFLSVDAEDPLFALASWLRDQGFQVRFEAHHEHNWIVVGPLGQLP